MSFSPAFRPSQRARRPNTGRALRHLALAALCLCFPPAASRAGLASEYEVKAAFLYNFARFVDWPEGTLAGSERPFVIAVIGDDPFGPALEATLAGKQVMQHPLALRRVDRAEDAVAAQIVFISASETPRLERVLQALAGHSILTVGETEDFALRGGMIGFRTEERRVRFDINQREAARARLRISSQLLRLANVVTGR